MLKPIFTLIATFMAAGSLLGLAETRAFALAAPLKSDRVIHDELVHGLRCDTLSVDSIYRAISPSAFSRDRRVETANDDVREKISSYGDCWSLSHWQRLALLLGRRNEASLRYSPLQISNLIRGTQSVLDGAAYARFGIEHHVDVALKSYDVFAMPPERNGLSEMGTLASDLNRIGRDYFSDLHAFQKKNFYRFSNLYYVLAPRAVENDGHDLIRAGKLARAHRLPMVILRPKRTYQHVVLLTGVSKIDDVTYNFEIIDPNYPTFVSQALVAKQVGSKIQVTYDGFDGEAEPVDVFLTGEDERPLIDQALLASYSRKCRQP